MDEGFFTLARMEIFVEKSPDGEPFRLWRITTLRGEKRKQILAEEKIAAKGSSRAECSLAKLAGCKARGPCCFFGAFRAHN